MAMLSVAVAVLVELEESGQRGLLLEFDPVVGHRCTPQRQRFKIPDRRIIECIQSAIDSGWRLTHLYE